MNELCSYAQHFIRGHTGDMHSLSAEPCHEGSVLHVIGQLSDSLTYFVLKCDRTRKHALAVFYIICIRRCLRITWTFGYFGGDPGL